MLRCQVTQNSKMTLYSWYYVKALPLLQKLEQKEASLLP
jgi:hypothetical protein